MRVSDFHFDLPEDLIAQHPPEVRGTSRMLVLNRAANTLTDANFTDLPSLLQPGDLLVLNDSRVLPARLFATRAGLTTQHNSPRPAGLVEILLTEQLPHPTDNLWHCLVKPARKVRPGETLLFHAPNSTEPVLTAEVLATGDYGERTLRFAPLPGGMPAFYEALTQIGHMPLPPYIHRDQATHPDTPEDRARYQTVYSHQPGSAAAPTAGLHFTPEVLAALEARDVEIAYLTLHVGLGTFQPVRVSELADIRLHSERYTLPPATAGALNRALAEKRRIVAVGTTTTRTLEHIAQESAQPTHPLPQIQPHSGQTSIFLSPGHRFRIVSGLLTNFHLPESTLLMLVAAFAGDTTRADTPDLDSETAEEPRQNPPNRVDPDHGRRTILAAYAHAIHHRYRFYSYGDCMLLL